MADAIGSIDLSACDQEPIHLLGAIQPMGFLIAVDSRFTILRVSDNVDEFVGHGPDRLLGHPLADIFDHEAIHELRNRLVQLHGYGGVERVFGIGLLAADTGRLFDCAVHIVGDLIVIEAEQSSPTAATEAAGLVRSMIGRLDATGELGQFLKLGARQVHGLTGFDRVMVYRFHDDGSGEVVAEIVQPWIEPLLGLHYPATDIPVQARALYLRTPFRIICDIDAAPVPIVPSLDIAGDPLDLSLSILRAVSPVHIAYLRNMGVVASLSVSIVVEGRLWGMFACHHYAPRCPSFDLRTLTELFAQMFAMRLESRERRAAAAVMATARRTVDRMMAAAAGDVALLGDPDRMMGAIGGMLPCDGVAIWLKGRAVSSGVTPDPAALPEIVDYLDHHAVGQVFATDSLAGILRVAGGGAEVPAGMLAIPMSSEPGDYMMLFRRERIRLVTWAGDPNKPVADPAETLTPRASFAAWREEVRGRSEPFTADERAIAEMLRSSLIEIVLRLAGAAIVEQQRAAQRQEVLIAELNHRVRNILTLISGLVRKSADPTIALSDYTDLLEGRILALARAHDQITQDNWGPAPICKLFETECAEHIAAGRLTLPETMVMLEPLALSTLALVVHELMTNSVKYGALSGDGRVDVEWTLTETGDLMLRWHEHGGPRVAPPRRHGLGTTIIEQSIPYDLGGTAAMTFAPSGLRADFVLPARHVRSVALREPPGSNPAKAPPQPDQPLERPAIHGTLLLVEDSLLIAIYVEDMLAQIGVTRVTTAGTVAAALSEISRAPPAAAILDINLVDDTSLPIADRLRAEGIPYVFSTGYGDTVALPDEHQRVPILQKPYTKFNLAAALLRTIGMDG